MPRNLASGSHAQATQTIQICLLQNGGNSIIVPNNLSGKRIPQCPDRHQRRQLRLRRKRKNHGCSRIIIQLMSLLLKVAHSVQYMREYCKFVNFLAFIFNICERSFLVGFAFSPFYQIRFDIYYLVTTGSFSLAIRYLLCTVPPLAT